MGLSIQNRGTIGTQGICRHDKDMLGTSTSRSTGIVSETPTPFWQDTGVA